MRRRQTISGTRATLASAFFQSQGNIASARIWTSLHCIPHFVLYIHNKYILSIPYNLPTRFFDFHVYQITLTKSIRSHDLVEERVLDRIDARKFWRLNENSVSFTRRRRLFILRETWGKIGRNHCYLALPNVTSQNRFLRCLNRGRP
jgi:hypothetical protein